MSASEGKADVQTGKISLFLGSAFGQERPVNSVLGGILNACQLQEQENADQQ